VLLYKTAAGMGTLIPRGGAVPVPIADGTSECWGLLLRRGMSLGRVGADPPRAPAVACIWWGRLLPAETVSPRFSVAASDSPPRNAVELAGTSTYKYTHHRNRRGKKSTTVL
jgi:hypothetical protein